MALDIRSLDFKPVHLEKRELRLLEIQTAKDLSDPVISRLVNVKVTEDLEYVALCALLRESEDTSTEDLWVNASRITVPATVGSALRHVRATFQKDQATLYKTLSNGSIAPPPRRPPRPKKQPGWLKHMMRGLRGEETSNSARPSPLRVWLDCLCINLRNEDEAEQRRSHLTLAYQSARRTFGWLGEKDPTSDLAITSFRQLDSLFPKNFGDKQDRIDHPENYSPRMTWLSFFAPLWKEDAVVNGRPEKGPLYMAVSGFLNRPFFKRPWIVEELTLSKSPAFLLSDEIVSWKETLQWNKMHVEFEKAGAEGFPKDLVETLTNMPKIDIGVVFTMLDDYDRRMQESRAAQQLLAASASTASMSPAGSFSDRNGPAPRPNTSRINEI